jgi:tricarballylate dehydrogenase
MLETGIVWEADKAVMVNGKRYYEPGGCIHPVGGGRGQLQQWRGIAEKMGIEIRFNSRVSAIHGDEFSVHGLRIGTREGSYDVDASAVIACSGGFQANAEMRARYLGANSDLVKVRGSRHNTGEVLGMMLQLGAKPAGHWQVAHASPIDAGAPDLETPLSEGGGGNTANRYDYRYGISVNSRGERFFNEGEGFISFTYAKLGREVLAQPGAIGWQIYDDTGIGLFRHGRNYRATMEEAETIPELAKKIGLNPQVLAHTIETYNKSINTGVAFDPTKLDGRGTKGLSPEKTNWAVAIEKPPFRAYPVACGVTFTFGGVGINTKSEVLNTSGDPIRGLYASGDVVGLFFFNYPAFTGQTRNAVFSLTAGRNAVTATN